MYSTVGELRRAPQKLYSFISGSALTCLRDLGTILQTRTSVDFERRWNQPLICDERSSDSFCEPPQFHTRRSRMCYRLCTPRLVPNSRVYHSVSSESVQNPRSLCRNLEPPARRRRPMFTEQGNHVRGPNDLQIHRTSSFRLR